MVPIAALETIPLADYEACGRVVGGGLEPLLRRPNRFVLALCPLQALGTFGRAFCADLIASKSDCASAAFFFRSAMSEVVLARGQGRLGNPQGSLRRHDRFSDRLLGRIQDAGRLVNGRRRQRLL